MPSPREATADPALEAAADTAAGAAADTATASAVAAAATASAVAAVAAAVRDHYVDAGQGARAAAAFAADLAGPGRVGQLAGMPATPAYDARLAPWLTAALHRHLPDPRLQVRWSDAPLSPPPVNRWDGPGDPVYRAREDLANQGVSRVERMEGNVGLVVLQAVNDPEAAGPVLDAAFTFLARCSALVLDLRRTFGGTHRGVAHLLGHLLPAGTPLTEVVNRDGRVIEATSAPQRAPTVAADIPLYALVGRRTVGACEELAYHLQVAGRAAVVGLTTPGAANALKVLAVDPHVLVRVPTVAVRHRGTGGSWEGLGVLPDVTCAIGDALPVAHRLAAREVLQRVRGGAIRHGEVLLEELGDVLAALDEDLGRDG